MLYGSPLPREPHPAKLCIMRSAATVAITSSLLAAGVLIAFPLVWMVHRSLFDVSPGSPDAYSLSNYLKLLSDSSWVMWLANSLYVASCQTLIACFAATLAGYVLAQHEFAGRRPLLVLLFATLLLPGQVTLPATWRLLNSLGLLNSYAALLIPAAGNVFGTLLFYHACRQMPQELLDAARIDGCSEWRIWWNIILPVVQPTLVTFAVLSFTTSWNAYLWPQIVLQDQQKYTLAMGLANMVSMPQQRDLGLMLAATTLSVIPAMGLLLVSRGSLEDSLTEGAVR